GTDALQVGARPRLGHRDRGDRLAAHAAGQPALLLLVGAERDEVRDDDVAVHREPRAPRARPGELLGHDRVVTEVVDARTAVLLGHVEAEHPELACPGPELAGHLPGGVPLLVVGGDLLLDEGAHGLAERLVLVVEDRSPAHAVHSFSCRIVAAGSSLAGMKFRLVTPDSRKAAIRSWT